MPSILVGSLIGIFLGIIPGIAAAVACFVAYNVMQKISRKGHLFGTGVLEGVAAPESSNSALTGGAMIPTLTLGVPGDPITAVMLGAFILIGIRPGPQIFREAPHFVYTVFAGWILIQFFILGMGFLFAKFSHYVFKIPPRVLAPLIVIFSIVGAYTLSNNLFDVQVSLIFGVIGLFMIKYDYPAAPLILGVILGPMAEENLNRAMLNSSNDIMILFQRPFSLAFLLLAFISIIAPVISAIWKKRKKTT